MRGKRFTFIKQNDAMQCGIASLAMISTYFGKALSIGTLSHYCFTTNEGVSLLGIRDTASITLISILDMLQMTFLQNQIAVVLKQTKSISLF